MDSFGSPRAITDIRYRRNESVADMPSPHTETPDRLPLRLFASGRKSRCGGAPYPFSPNGTLQTEPMMSPGTASSEAGSSASSRSSTSRCTRDEYLQTEEKRNPHKPFEELLASAEKYRQSPVNHGPSFDNSDTDTLLRQSAAYGLRLASELQNLRAQVEELQLTNDTLESRLCETRVRLQQERRQSMHHLQDTDRELRELREEEAWANNALQRTLREVSSRDGNDSAIVHYEDDDESSPEQHNGSKKASRFPREGIDANGGGLFLCDQGKLDSPRLQSEEAQQKDEDSTQCQSEPEPTLTATSYNDWESSNEEHFSDLIHQLEEQLHEKETELFDTRMELDSTKCCLDDERQQSEKLRQQVVHLEEALAEVQTLLKEKQGVSFSKFGTPTHSPRPVDHFEAASIGVPRYSDSPVSSPLVPRKLGTPQQANKQPDSPEQVHSALQDELEKSMLLDQLERSSYQLKCAKESNDMLRETVRLLKERHAMSSEDTMSRSAFSVPRTPFGDKSNVIDLNNDDEPLLPHEKRLGAVESPCGGSYYESAQEMEPEEENSETQTSQLASPFSQHSFDDVNELFTSPRHVSEINQENWENQQSDHTPYRYVDSTASRYSTDSNLDSDCQIVQQHLARIHANLVGNREKRRHIAFNPAQKHDTTVKQSELKMLAESLEDFMCCLVSLLTNMNECCTGHTDAAILVLGEQDSNSNGDLGDLSPKSDIARTLRRTSSTPKLQVLTPAQREEIAEDCPVSRWSSMTSDFPANFVHGSLKLLVQELCIRSSRWKVARTRHLRTRKSVREILGHHQQQVDETMEVTDRFEEIVRVIIGSSEAKTRESIIDTILSSGTVVAAQLADDLVDALLEETNQPTCKSP